MSLAALAHDQTLLPEATPPRFPGSLLLVEERYLEAVASEQQAEAIDSKRRQLRAAIEEQLGRDRNRLAGLTDGIGSRVERDLLEARIVVLDSRLSSLRPGVHVPDAGVSARRPRPRRLTNDADADSAGGAWMPAEGRRARLPFRGARPRETPTSPLADEPTPAHRNDIQGLRAIAVLLVALSHAGVRFLKGGFVGVDVFFVLSGFLITGLLLSEARSEGRVSILGFYLRRARRILPAALLTLVVADLAVYHLLNFVRAKQYLLDSIPSALFTANIHFGAIGTDYFARGQPPSPFQHFWSLAVEEQFYAVWPAVFALAVGLTLRRYSPHPRDMSRAARRLLALVGAIAAGSIAWSITYTGGHRAAAYFSTPARAWELALGAAIAIAAPQLGRVASRWRTAGGWVGFGCIVIAAIVFSGGTPFPGYAALLPTVGAALVIWAGAAAFPGSRSPARLLSIAPLRYIGDRSYAFYLWHWPVLVIAAQRAGHDLSVATNLLLLAGAFGLSIVSYRLVENPLRHAAVTQRPDALLAWVASVVAVVVLATTYVSSIDNREVRQRLNAQNVAAPLLSLGPTPSTAVRLRQGSAAAPAGVVSQVLPAVMDIVNGKVHRQPSIDRLNPPVGDVLSNHYDLPARCSAHVGETSSAVCRMGTVSSSRMIVVVGDSHAEMWIPDVLSLAQSERWVVVPLTKSGCSPLDWNGSGPPDCRAWFRWAMKEVGVLHPAVALLSGYFSYVGPGGRQALIDAFDSAVQPMKKAARRVVIIGDAPERARQPVDCLLDRTASAAGCFDTLPQQEIDLTSQLSQYAESQGIGFIDTTGWFCYAEQCPLVVADTVTYRDLTHVSLAYARALTGVFRIAFDRLVPAGRHI